MANPFEKVVEFAKARRVGEVDFWTRAYLTEGGTYMIASQAGANDDDMPHDLVAVLSNGWMDMLSEEHSRVVVLRPTVNPALVNELRLALDG